MHYDLVDLRLITRVAETHSVAAGAEASHLSVPAAGTQIKNLEDAVGNKLPFRASQAVTLTAAGFAAVHHPH